MRKRLSCGIVVLVTAFLLSAYFIKQNNDSNDFKRIEGSIFGTTYRVVYLAGPEVEIVRAAVEEELERIDDMASTWKQDSELMQYQRSSEKETFMMSNDLAGLLQRSEEIKKMTGGAFDVRYKPGQIDLSGIAKGYAVDQITELLVERFSITSSLVEIGGEIKIRGRGSNGDAWNVGIYVATEGPGSKPTELQLRDTSIATSGTSFKGDHLIDPKSGKPSQSGLLGVSVIHPSNTTADALATALFVMGLVEGVEWAEANEIHAIFFLADGESITVDE